MNDFVSEQKPAEHNQPAFVLLFAKSKTKFSFYEKHSKSIFHFFARKI
jgi:hypothetical protein